MAKKKVTNYDSRDYRAIRNSDIPAAVMMSAGSRFDSAESASVFFARELDYVKAQSYDVEYPELTALKLFPMTSEADEGAETITYYTYDKTGIAKVISNYSTDLPRADVDGKPSFAQIKSIGASYGYSVQEMRASRLAGKSLDVRKAEAARYAIDAANNKIAWAGDKESGLLGVLSPEQNIPYFLVTAGKYSGYTSWTKKSPDEILDDINGMAKQVARDTKNVERPDTLVLPAEVYMHIATKRIPHTTDTVLKFLLDNSPYIKKIESAAELDYTSDGTNPFAGATGGTYTDAYGNTATFAYPVGCALLFTNSNRKLSLEMPMAFNQYPVQVRNLDTVVPCEARTAGVIVYYPMSACIAIGVSIDESHDTTAKTLSGTGVLN